MNVNVNAIAPGMTMSDAGKALTPEESPFVQAAMARVVKQPRGQPQDLVGALLLLCSPAGDWITGQALNVDGGFIMRNEGFRRRSCFSTLPDALRGHSLRMVSRSGVFCLAIPAAAKWSRSSSLVSAAPATHTTQARRPTPLRTPGTPT